MPRGVPRKGFRMTAKRRELASQYEGAGLVQRAVNPLIPVTIPQQSEPEVQSNETDEQIDARIAERFSVLEVLIEGAIAGNVRALIVSGPAGLGKSYTIEQKLAEWDPNEVNHRITKGYVKATGLYKLLHAYKEKHQVLVFDDADSVFFDETGLNFLKAVCDSSDKRRVSYLTEGTLFDDETGQSLPKSFEFQGTVIFITNLDFDGLIAKNHKLTPHLQALMSRAHYVDLSMKTRRDCLIRIKQVMKTGLLEDQIGKDGQQEILEFIEENINRMREMSLRSAIKIANIRATNKNNWKQVARVTCLKQ